MHFFSTDEKVQTSRFCCPILWFGLDRGEPPKNGPDLTKFDSEMAIFPTTSKRGGRVGVVYSLFAKSGDITLKHLWMWCYIEPLLYMVSQSSMWFYIEAVLYCTVVL